MVLAAGRSHLVSVLEQALVRRALRRYQRFWGSSIMRSHSGSVSSWKCAAYRSTHCTTRGSRMMSSECSWPCGTMCSATASRSTRGLSIIMQGRIRFPFSLYGNRSRMLRKKGEFAASRIVFSRNVVHPEMGKHARFYSSRVQDVQVTPATCKAAIHRWSVVPEIRQEDRQDVCAPLRSFLPKASRCSGVGTRSRSGSLPTGMNMKYQPNSAPASI